jgi:hypothetical protein
VKVCSFPECDKPLRYTGYCSGHYRQQHQGRPLTPLRKKGLVGCSFDGCEKVHYSKGFCKGHYAQQWEGRPLTPLKVARREIRDGLAFCSLCDEWRDRSDFYPSNQTRTGCNTYCKECNGVSKYGLNRHTWRELFESQGSRCACCGTDVSSHKNGWVVDHDHSCCPDSGSCGKCVRSILCNGCNLMLGNANDEISRLIAGAEYLKRHNTKENA